MARFVKCSDCGEKYNEEIWDKCPFCNPGVKDNQQKDVKNDLLGKSRWYNFAKALLIIESVIVFIFILICIVAGFEGGSVWFVYAGAAIGDYIFAGLFIAVIQLLAEIKFGIDSLNQKMDK